MMSGMAEFFRIGFSSFRYFQVFRVHGRKMRLFLFCFRFAPPPPLLLLPRCFLFTFAGPWCFHLIEIQLPFFFFFLLSPPFFSAESVSSSCSFSSSSFECVSSLLLPALLSSSLSSSFYSISPPSSLSAVAPVLFSDRIVFAVSSVRCDTTDVTSPTPSALSPSSSPLSVSFPISMGVFATVVFTFPAAPIGVSLHFSRFHPDSVLRPSLFLFHSMRPLLFRTSLLAFPLVCPRSFV